ANKISRTVLRSDEVLKDETGRFTITLAAEARSGTWFPLPHHGAYTLILRLYDTPPSLLADLRDGALPRIERKGCQ
ncbi:DUF1214 domain-containing protein, partial [Acinetobacter baumannii]